MSVTDTTTPDAIVAREWDKLEPAMLNPKPHAKHVKLKASTTFAAGQIVGPITADPGRYDKPGVGVTGPYLPLMYPWVTNAAGDAKMGDSLLTEHRGFEASVEVYYTGAFYIRDLTGVADDTIMNATGRLVQGTGRADVNAILELG